MGVVRGDCSELGCWVGDLPEGCRLCIEGLKTVIFITGLCKDQCYYCPISRLRRGVDVVYVNEVRLDHPDDVRAVKLEVIASGSRGVGITGGDPLLVVERAVRYISMLKEVFGDGFHIHLYTSGTQAQGDVLRRLSDAGLDEIRFHVVSRASWRAIKDALRYPMDVVVEVPAIPGSVSGLMSVVKMAEELGVKYVNINELEVSDSNYEALALRGFKAKDGRAAAGSELVALEVLRIVGDSGAKISVHYCPAVFKDRYQLGRRLARRGLRTKYVYEDLAGCLVRWVRFDKESCTDLARYLLTDMITSSGRYYLVNPRLVKKLRDIRCYGELVEALPTDERELMNIFPSIPPHNIDEHSNPDV